MRRVLALVFAVAGTASPAFALPDCRESYGGCNYNYMVLDGGIYYMEWQCSNGDRGGGRTDASVYNAACGGA